MNFEWDPRKAAKNLRRHGVSFAEAATVFGDSLGATVPDPGHSTEEDRYIVVGMSQSTRYLLVAFVERGDRIRLISARELTHVEREAYEEDTSG